MDTAPGTARVRAAHDAAGAWRSPLLHLTLAGTLFLTLGGLWIFFAPFSAYNQYSVLLHTVVGVVYLVPYAVYQTRHFLATWRLPLGHVALLGYTGGAVLLAAVVSGVVLTLEASVGTRISYGWRLVHIVSGLSLAALVPLHVTLALVRRARGQRAASVRPIGPPARQAGLRTAFATLVLLAVPLLPSVLYPGLDPVGTFPLDYGYKYGTNPFSPSLAMTAHGGAIRPEALAGSESCGLGGCHEEIVEEWLPSAHRYASRSMFFQAIQKTMADNNGPESTRYCGGCHDPIALFSGSKNIYDEDLSSHGADEGVSCAACHSIVQTDVKGNANYVIELPRRYVFEESTNAAARFASKFLIRSYPAHHVASYTRDLYKTPEFCGACHKQFIDKEINRVGWVQLQNQYDNWRKSHWFRAAEGDPSKADPRKTTSCRECHMRLSPSRDPAAGDEQDYNRAAGDGKHRNHRFIGANQWLPTLHDLPGGDEQVRLTEEWLRGETEIPEIADKWARGPAAPLELIAPEKVRAGEEVTVRAVVSSNKVGHDFPTGPLDIIQSWVELKVFDEDGSEIFSSGTLNEENFIQEGSFIFKAEGVDKAGNLIDRHNLWEMVGARFRRSLFPGFSDTAEYRFACPLTRMVPDKTAAVERTVTFPAPEEAPGRLTVKARLRYRKVDQTLINFIMPGKGLTAPVTDMSFAEARIALEPRSE